MLIRLLHKYCEKSIFLDSQSTTRLDFRVLDAVLPYSMAMYGNPHSRTHEYGWESSSAVEKARAQVADLIGAEPSEIVFTSGATESNNMSIGGLAQFYGNEKKHFVTTQTEHKCVLSSFEKLQAKGFRVTYLPVLPSGIIDLNEFEKAVTKEPTIAASVMGVNNEIGIIQPLKEIGQICRRHGVFFHSDCAQAVGKISLDLKQINIDLMSISGHKLYGPKGVGALYVRKKPRVRLTPIMSGGGQERGLRSGTVPTHLVVGLGKACQIAGQDMQFDKSHINKLSRLLVDKICSIEQVRLNGDPIKRFDGCLNFSFTGVGSDGLMISLKKFAVSSGSACSSESLEPSYVLRALNLDTATANSAIRIGLNRFTREWEVVSFFQAITQEVKRLRAQSHTWEYGQAGGHDKTYHTGTVVGI